MSRRFTQRATATPDVDVEVTFFEGAGIPIWYATPMPYPWDAYFWHQWQSAWAEHTLHVTGAVWRNEGAKLYVTHRDPDLKDDLRSWLTVKAVEAGADFRPDPWHPAPERDWAKWLYGRLRVKARQHFADVVGWSGRPSGQAAVDGRRRTGPSIEAQAELEAETGARWTHHSLWARPFETDDPANVLIRLEELHNRVIEVERDDHVSGFYATPSGPGTTCMVNLCTRPVRARGLCHNHYYAERKHATDRGDWQAYTPPAACEVDGCEGKHYSRSRCRTHYEQLRRDEAPRCTTPGCDAPRRKAGGSLCTEHHREANRAVCVLPDCGDAVRAKGLCNRHYQQEKKGRLQR